MKKTIDYYLKLPYRLEIVPDTNEGGYGACYPDLPGCITCSDTIEGISMNQYCLYLLTKNDAVHTIKATVV